MKNILLLCIAICIPKIVGTGNTPDPTTMTISQRRYLFAQILSQNGVAATVLKRAARLGDRGATITTMPKAIEVKTEAETELTFNLKPGGDHVEALAYDLERQKREVMFDEGSPSVRSRSRSKHNGKDVTKQNLDPRPASSVPQSVQEIVEVIAVVNKSIEISEGSTTIQDNSETPNTENVNKKETNKARFERESAMMLANIEKAMKKERGKLYQSAANGIPAERDAIIQAKQSALLRADLR